MPIKKWINILNIITFFVKICCIYWKEIEEQFLHSREEKCSKKCIFWYCLPTPNDFKKSIFLWILISSSLRHVRCIKVVFLTTQQISLNAQTWIELKWNWLSTLIFIVHTYVVTKSNLPFAGVKIKHSSRSIFFQTTAVWEHV